MTSSDSSAPPQPPAQPRFTLGGPAQSRLSLVAPFPWGAGALGQLELELTGRASDPVSRRRGRVQRAELIIDEAQLNRTLAEKLGVLLPLLPPLGPVLEHVRVRLAKDAGGPQLQVRARLRDAGTPLWCSLRVRLRACKAETGPVRSADALALGLVEEEVRVYGLTATPSPILGLLVRWVLALALCEHRRAAPPAEAKGQLGLQLTWTSGLWVVGIELLHDALLATLPRAGYRAADPATASLGTVRLDGGRLHLGYRSAGRRDVFGEESSEEWLAPTSEPITFAVPEVACLGDRLLLTGDYAAAVAAYGLAEQSAGISEMMQARRRQVLLAAPSRQEEAELLFSEALRRSPHDGSARLALALLAGARGELATAAERLLELGEEAAGPQAGPPEERALALLTAARCLTVLDRAAAAAAAHKAQALLRAVPDGDEELLGEAAELHAELTPAAVPPEPVLPPPAPAAPVAPATSESADADTGPEEPELILQRAGSETLPAALTRLDRALRTLVGPARLRLCLSAARLCQQRGEIARARLYLEQAGEHPEALHQRVQLDLPELMLAEPGEPADLMPVLQRLQRRGLATRDELSALARLHSGRGQHRDAFTAQRAAGGEPEELLAGLEAGGEHRVLVDALLVHARLMPERAAELYQRAARVAQQQLSDPARAASLWQTAAAALAEHSAERAEAAVLWAHAGHLWHAYGSYDRAEAALRKALELGGEQTPLVLLALGHHAYAQADLTGAADAYRRALAADQVPPAERPQVFLRLAEIEHERGDAAAEERELAAAVEAGGGALAWPALAALFRASGDGPRLGAALLGWADYETGEMRRSLLIQAAALCGPSLLGRADEELVRLDADDEAVRDRLQTRLRQSGTPEALLAALVRDLDKSHGLRRLTAARELRELAARLCDDTAAARAHIAILEGLPGGERPEAGPAEPESSPPPSAADTLAALAFATDRRRSGGALPEELTPRLRELLLQKGALRALLARMDRQLALLTEHPRERRGRVKLLRQTAELSELLGDGTAAATRWLRLCGADPEDLDALARCRRLLRRQATAGQAAAALALCQAELRRSGETTRRASGLRVVQAELLLFMQRADEALGQLELVLMRAETFGPAHAVLGMLLATSPHAGDAERSIEHLLTAAYAPDVEPHEAGECALVAAELLTAAPTALPGPLPATRRDAAAEAPPSYLGRAAAGTWVAVPSDFLEEALSPGDQPVPSTLSPARPGSESPQISDTPPPVPSALPRAPAEPRALFLHAAALLPGDPRPLEGLLGLAWTEREYEQALSYCDQLLELAKTPGQRARLLVEKAYVLLRLDGESTAHALLDEALALAPEYPPALRALRRLVRSSGDLEQAVALLQRELHARLAGEPAARAALLLELGQLQRLRGEPGAAQEAFRRAGQLGSAEAWRFLAEELLERREFLGAADAMGRAATLLPAGERGAALVEAAQLAVRADDELRARDHLEQAVMLGGPAAEAARALLLELDGGPDAGERRRLLERRLHQVSEGLGYIDVLARLLLLCRAQGDEAATIRYGEALLAQKPGDELALCALAELAYRDQRLDEAEALLAGVSAIPETLERPGLLLRGLAELRARRGDLDGAERAYAELLARGEHDAEAESVLAATTALAELLSQRGAWAEVTAVLKVRLLYLPEAASAEAALRERVALRLRIAEAAERGGDLAEAEQQLTGVLAEQPGHRDALRRIRLIHAARRDDAKTLAALAELIAGAASPRERAEWLSERAALLSERGERAAALADYRQILALIPGDERTLQRMRALVD